MEGLGENEKYNAVLQGVSSIVMGKKKVGDAARGAFEEVFQLLDEMHANRIKCSIRTASAVVDAATATTDIGIITKGVNCRIFLYSEQWPSGPSTNPGVGQFRRIPPTPSKHIF